MQFKTNSAASNVVLEEMLLNLINRATSAMREETKDNMLDCLYSAQKCLVNAQSLVKNGGDKPLPYDINDLDF
jgi:hypothetical protein